MSSRQPKKSRRPLQWKIQNFSRKKKRDLSDKERSWDTLVLRKTHSKILRNKGIQRKYFRINGPASSLNSPEALMELRTPLWMAITREMNKMGLDANSRISLGLSIDGSNVPGSESSWGSLENIEEFDISDLDWQLSRLASFLQSDKTVNLRDLEISLTAF